MNTAEELVQELELVNLGLLQLNQRVDSVETSMRVLDTLTKDMVITLRRIIDNVS